MLFGENSDGENSVQPIFSFENNPFGENSVRRKLHSAKIPSAKIPSAKDPSAKIPDTVVSFLFTLCRHLLVLIESQSLLIEAQAELF